MKPAFRTRLWLELALASTSGLLAVLSMFWLDWLEALTGFDPDEHSGSVEWAVVVLLAFACVAVSLVARAEWRGTRSLAAAGS